MSRWALTLPILAAFVACSVYGTEDESAPGPNDGGDSAADGGNGGVPDGAPAKDGASDGASDAGADPCPVGLGPTMALFTTEDGRRFCVDRTEVSAAEYAAFRSALADTTPHAPRVPSGCAQVTVAAIDVADDAGNLPRVNVSFCSAAYYCAAQGKRLCGSLADGGAIVIDSGADPILEWEVACSNGKPTNYFPWGTTDPNAASTASCLTQTTAPDASAPRAVGASACGPAGGLGPYDMIGNVWEWVNVRRDVPGVSYTGARGGSFLTGTPTAGCGTTHGVNGVGAGDYAPGAPSVGFRCCADPLK